jgi:aspartate kinase
VRSFSEDNDVVVVVSALTPKVKSEGTTSLLLESAAAAVGNGDFQTPLDNIRDHHLETLFQIGATDRYTDETRIFIERTIVGLEQFLEAISVIKEVSPRTHDAIVSVGELLSARLLSTGLPIGGVRASYVDLSQICSKRYDEPTPGFWKDVRNRIDKLLEPQIEDDLVPVITGFLGPVPGGIIDAVGRGYTDHTAALSAAAVGAKELQIWKEVDGVFSANPDVVPGAAILDSLSPEEASEITYFGSEVIHPMTMERAIDAGIPLRVKNTFQPGLPGTVISNSKAPTPFHSPIRCVTSKNGIVMLNVRSNRMFHAHGFLAKLFDIMERHATIVDLVTTSEVSVSMTIDESENLEPLIADLATVGEVTVRSGMSIVSVVGKGMKGTVGLAAKIFGCLAEEDINIEMIGQGASKINVSCVIEGSHADRAVRALHKEFIEAGVTKEREQDRKALALSR